MNLTIHEGMLQTLMSCCFGLLEIRWNFYGNQAMCDFVKHTKVGICCPLIQRLPACESGALEKGRQDFEMRCYQRLLNILCKCHVTNEEVHRKIQAATEE